MQLTINSILKNSLYDHQIIVHVNGEDVKSEDYLIKNNIEYTKSNHNIGLCNGVNKASKYSSSDYIVYSHDDMYFLPNWDLHLLNEIKKIQHNYFFLSATQVGPIPYIDKKPNHIYFDAGIDFDNFNEKNLLKIFEDLPFYDLQGSHWAPHVIHRDIWERIGGFSEEFSPGFGSDPDLNMKLWSLGVRIFKGVNKSRIYHFGSITTRKNINVVKNKANKTFLMKWGISIKFFTKYYLNRGNIYIKPLDNFKINSRNILQLIMCKIKFFFYKLFF